LLFAVMMALVAGGAVAKKAGPLLTDEEGIGRPRGGATLARAFISFVSDTTARTRLLPSEISGVEVLR
jgi:hypothetical protein